MTREEAAKMLNCSLSELAVILEVSTASVAQWGDLPIPPLREYQVRDIAAGRTPLGLSKTKHNLAEQNN